MKKRIAKISFQAIFGRQNLPFFNALNEVKDVVWRLDMYIPFYSIFDGLQEKTKKN